MRQLPDFDRFEGQLDREGWQALERLKDERDKFHTSILRLMDRIRNKGTFHYIRNEFAEGIMNFKVRLGADVQSSFIFEGRPPKIRAHYLLADHVRDAAGFGIQSPEEIDEVIKDLIHIQRALIIFLDSAMLTYAKDRRLEDKFKNTPH